MPRISAKNGAHSDDSVKITLKLPKKSMDRLSVLMDETEATSKSEVLRNALRLYEVVVRGKNEGKYVFIEDRNGKRDSVFL